jgi:hypothetical protein
MILANGELHRGGLPPAKLRAALDEAGKTSPKK